jgi:hypothetical protein
VGSDATLKEPNTQIEKVSSGNSSCFQWVFFPCALICNWCSSSDESSELQLRLVGVLEVSSFSFIFELFSRVHKYTAPWLKCIVWHPQEL